MSSSKRVLQVTLVRRMVREHAELRAMLDACLSGVGAVDSEQFDRFRRRTLRHMAIEETVLAPLLEARVPGRSRFRRDLRKDHTAIVALCVPSPNRDWLEDLRGQLAFHNAEEEAAGGFYQLYATHVGEDPAVNAALRAIEPLAVPPFRDGVGAAGAMRDILRATGITGTMR